MTTYLIAWIILSFIVGSVSYGINLANLEKKYSARAYIIVYIIWLVGWPLLWLTFIGYWIGKDF